MFNKLVASQGKRRSRWSWGTTGVSVVVHAGLLALLVAVGVGAEQQLKKNEELVDFMEVEPEKPAEPEPPKPEEPPPPEPEPEAPPPVVKGFQELVPPTEPPQVIPDVDPNQQAVNADDFSGEGKAGGLSDGVPTGVAQDASDRDTPADEGTYDISAVEVRPELSNRSEVARLVERNYPPLLRDAGISGSVTLSFVVNEDGRVNEASIEVLDASHEGFADAARRAVSRMRFRPAKVNNQAVKVKVSIPVTFTVPR
jgi:protein TonB